jgi:hypothetical protein
MIWPRTIADLVNLTATAVGLVQRFIYISPRLILSIAGASGWSATGRTALAPPRGALASVPPACLPTRAQCILAH